MKIFFILKKREEKYSDECYSNFKSGLFYSVKFIIDMLNNNDIEAKLIEVQDNNDIDREVTLYNPSHVIIEALWVVPEKFEILKKLHPKIEWIIRLHSEIPFIANEGISIEWIKKYVTYDKIKIATNSNRCYNDLSVIIDKNKLIYLPNTYNIVNNNYKKCIDKKEVNIGCFGAIRPMKNQLIQALAAIKFAEENKLKLKFHINGSRCEQGGNNVYKNIKNLFNNSKHELIEHTWLDHDKFLNLLKEIDIGMQLSFSETFNIVTADYINMNVPVVVSDEIKWISDFYKADENDLNSIANKLNFIYKQSKITNFIYKIIGYNYELNKIFLRKYCENSNKIWINYFRKT